jgi:hypothetical protein
MMKTTLILSALAATLLTVSTPTFAQNFGGYAQALGTTATNRDYVAPVDRFTRSDLGYQGRVTVPRTPRH